MDHNDDRRSLGERDAQLLQWMRHRRRQHRAELAQALQPAPLPGPSLGQRVASSLCKAC